MNRTVVNWKNINTVIFDVDGTLISDSGMGVAKFVFNIHTHTSISMMSNVDVLACLSTKSDSSALTASLHGLRNVLSVSVSKGEARLSTNTNQLKFG